MRDSVRQQQVWVELLEGSEAHAIAGLKKPVAERRNALPVL